MKRLLLALIFAATTANADGSAIAAKLKQDCRGFDPTAEHALSTVSLPPASTCTLRTKTVNGKQYSLPDRACTPGATNPTLTLKILKKPLFRTGCERDKATSAAKKVQTYLWYAQTRPKNNKGKKMICELDHLISIEIGGADTLDNIWPQCGPAGTSLNKRYFKQKDLVENWLAIPFRAGKTKLTLGSGEQLSLSEVQRRMADDWTQFLPDAAAYYQHHPVRNDGG